MVVSDHPGPQPLPEISHRDCAGVNCTQKSRQRGAQQLGTLRAQKIYEELRQFVWWYFHRKSEPIARGFAFYGKWGEYKLD